MSIAQPSVALEMVDVFDRGRPNEERIILKVNVKVSLSTYGLIVGMLQPDGSAVPFRDHFLWMGDAVVRAGDWIMIYTGAGEPSKTRLAEDAGDLYTAFWGKSSTLFASSKTVPILFRFDDVVLGQEPVDRPQRLALAT